MASLYIAKSDGMLYILQEFASREREIQNAERSDNPFSEHVHRQVIPWCRNQFPKLLLDILCGNRESNLLAQPS